MFGASDEPASEMLPVIETSGLVVGQASRKECHSRSLLHPAVRLLVVNRAGEFYLRATTQTPGGAQQATGQQPDSNRAANSPQPAGNHTANGPQPAGNLTAGSQSLPWPQSVWDDAAAGHVAFGEKCSEALYRNAADQIGLRQFHPIHLASYLDSTEGARELVNLYATVGDFGLGPRGDGISKNGDGGWWTPDKVEEMLGKGIFTPGFEFDWKNFKDKALALL